MVVVGLGTVWILDGLAVTIVGAIGGRLTGRRRRSASKEALGEQAGARGDQPERAQDDERRSDRAHRVASHQHHQRTQDHQRHTTD
jgi:hypothetical protein